MHRVRFETVDHTAYVTLNRPDSRNSFGPEMIAELTEVFRNIARNTLLRVVVLQGEGKSFCAGADLAWMQSMAGYTIDENIKDAEALHEMFATIRACDVPVVASVHGHVIGGALGLLAVCDLVIAEENTVFCFSEVKLGLIPAVISPFIFEKTNRGHAQRFMITGEMFTAMQAEMLGLVHEIGTAAEVKAILEKVLATLHLNGPEAMRATKALLREISRDTSAADVSKVTTEAIAQRRVGPEGQEGLRAFFAKQDPSWRVKL